MACHFLYSSIFGLSKFVGTLKAVLNAISETVFVYICQGCDEECLLIYLKCFVCLVSF